MKPKIGPGPGKYALPPVVGYKDHDGSRYRYPQYSIGPMLPIIKKEIGPGPKYDTANLTSYGPVHPPAYSIKSRPQPLSKAMTPGPANYNIQDVPRMKEKRPPAYTISGRHPPLKHADTPGPDKYELPSTLGPKVPDLHAAGAYSMGRKNPQLTKEKSPGPAQYSLPTPNATKNRDPVYSMSTRNRELTKFQGPGPSAYYPRPPEKGGYSFGIKTGNDPYIVPQDEMPCVNK